MIRWELRPLRWPRCLLHLKAHRGLLDTGQILECALDRFRAVIAGHAFDRELHGVLEPNSALASAPAVSVFPTPVGPSGKSVRTGFWRNDLALRETVILMRSPC